LTAKGSGSGRGDFAGRWPRLGAATGPPSRQGRDRNPFPLYRSDGRRRPSPPCRSWRKPVHPIRSTAARGYGTTCEPMDCRCGSPPGNFPGSRSGNKSPHCCPIGRVIGAPSAEEAAREQRDNDNPGWQPDGRSRSSQTSAGVPVATFTVAATSRVQDRASGEWCDDETLVLRCSVWRRTGRGEKPAGTQRRATAAAGWTHHRLTTAPPAGRNRLRRGQKPRSEGVRREGLEPPTRGLRDRRRGVRGGAQEYVVAGQSVMSTTAACRESPRMPTAGHHAGTKAVNRVTLHRSGQGGVM